MKRLSGIEKTKRSERIYNYRLEGKTHKEIGLFVGMTASAASNDYHNYCNINGLEKVKPNLKKRGRDMTNPKPVYNEVEADTLIAEGIDCQIIRRGERTYSVNTEMGTGLVTISKPHKLIGPLKECHAMTTGRSFTGVFNSTRRGRKSLTE